MTVLDRLRAIRRRLVHDVGKRLLRAAGAFQARHSKIPTTPFLGNDTFPWIGRIEADWRVIRAELEPLLRRPEDIPSFHQLSPDQQRISRGDNWKTYAFYVMTHRVDENCAACPATARLLDTLPHLQNAWFSILAPRYHIPPHHGPTRAFVRCHLGLVVPRDREQCWLRVADQIRHWDEGRCLLFDDTYEHEVRNDTDEVRVVLFLDFDRPMDAIGTWFNRVLLRLIRASHYFRDPIRNLALWNRRLRREAQQATFE